MLAIASNFSPAEVAVVHDADLDPVGDAGRLGSLPRFLGLRRGEGDADDAGPVAGRRPEREAAPAAADVEDTVALLQLELAGDGLELLLLGLLERPRPPREDPAAVGHRGVEEEREELVGDVVVVADGARVALLGVAAAARAQLGAGRLGRPGQAGGADGAEQERALVGPLQGRRLPAVEEGDHGVHVVDLDLAADVGPAEAELPGRPQHVGGGARRAQEEGRAAVRRRGEAGPIPKLDPERPLGDAGFDLAPQRRGVRQRHSPSLLDKFS